ncbi:SDR family oxidoreductase [Mycolicibacterium porcinum]|uniref:SDR family oxidoreductase n=1 Tax=Mycolicibacterium porcinum TaxID=39693 RepID=A0AAW5T1Q8_9MYCO|nr:SDR family oxidoreductase [Mycolicibacterium porcinum]MCV7389345.1 SDR family oxidoreductase [Mycolicibacterium porcinum]ORB44844.1 short-chain dehydrogenase [Mycolicibacterium porcinum]CDO27741.1 putative short chain dehydrogenase/reductase [Mycolicibacterium vulneris]
MPSHPSAHPFAGRTIVLIGGGSGIGLATARLVTAGKGTVVLGGRTPERLAAAAASLGPQAGWHQVDTADQDSIDAFFDFVGTRFGSVHGLFTTAADYLTGPMARLSVDQAATAFDSKFWGQYRVVKSAIPVLSPDAAIVLMSGAASARPAAVAPAYSAANAAIEGLARGLAVELAPVTVNAIAPGTVEGNLWSQRDPAIREQAFAAYRDASTIGRLADEDEIAQSVGYLLSSRITTGSTLFPDGGYAFR